MWIQKDGVSKAFPVVAKESKFHVDDEMSLCKQDLMVQAKACKLAKIFGSTVLPLLYEEIKLVTRRPIVDLHFPGNRWQYFHKSGKVVPENMLDNKQVGFKMVEPDLYMMHDPASMYNAEGNMRCMIVERYVNGQYEKYNGNAGYVKPDKATAGYVTPEETGPLSTFNRAQAFTHWTYEYTHESSETLMVCDIQGSFLNFTDPAIASEARSYGETDLGVASFKKFFANHQCNALCNCLGLTELTAHSISESHSANTATTISSITRSTSEMTVLPTNHLQFRKQERALDTKILQKVKKYGEQTPSHGARVIHEYQGVSYVTDQTRKIGITAWRQPSTDPNLPPRAAPLSQRALRTNYSNTSSLSPLAEGAQW